MVTYRIVVNDPLGLHLRPAGKLCEISLKYQSKVQLKNGDHVANAKSVLSVLAARVQQGDEIELICDGADEEEVLNALVKMLQEDINITEVG